MVREKNREEPGEKLTKISLHSENQRSMNFCLGNCFCKGFLEIYFDDIFLLVFNFFAWPAHFEV